MLHQLSGCYHTGCNPSQLKLPSFCLFTRFSYLLHMHKVILCRCIRSYAVGYMPHYVCALGSSCCMLFCRLLILFKNKLFRKILLGIPSECQTVWIQIRPDILSGLMWVQPGCKSSQQSTLVKELIVGKKLVKYMF